MAFYPTLTSFLSTTKRVYLIFLLSVALLIIGGSVFLGLFFGLKRHDSDQTPPISNHDSNFDSFEEEPYIPGPCDRPLNVIVTGMFGAGKSSLINNLYGLYNITNDHDKSLVAIQSGVLRSVTLQCNIYMCESNKDFKHSPLNLMDTPGFEAFEKGSRNLDIAKTIANASLHSFGPENRIDAIYIVMQHERQKASSTRNLVNQIQMITDPKIYDRVVFIITRSETVAASDREKEWARIKRLYVAHCPELANIFSRASYVFSGKHEFRKTPDGKTITIETERRREIALEIHSKTKDICEFHNATGFHASILSNQVDRFDENLKQLIEFKGLHNESEAANGFLDKDNVNNTDPSLQIEKTKLLEDWTLYGKLFDKLKSKADVTTVAQEIEIFGKMAPFWKIFIQRFKDFNIKLAKRTQ